MNFQGHASIHNNGPLSWELKTPCKAKIWIFRCRVKNIRQSCHSQPTVWTTQTHHHTWEDKSNPLLLWRKVSIWSLVSILFLNRGQHLLHRFGQSPCHNTVGCPYMFADIMRSSFLYCEHLLWMWFLLLLAKANRLSYLLIIKIRVSA